MYNLFNSPTLFNPALNRVTGWNQTRGVVLDEMNKLAKHYRVSAQFSRNQNVLNQILTTVDVSPNTDKNYVAECVREDFSSLVGTFGFYSSITTTRNPPISQFYNNNCLELLVYDDSWFDANAVKGNWQQLEPIKVLEHPFDDINLNMPNNHFQSSLPQKGLAVISVNVAMLIVQFHYWVESIKEFTGDVTTTQAQFLVRYPMFNAMKSHLDISIRNRFFKLYNKEPVSNFLKIHPVAIRDYSQLLDNALRNVCQTLRTKNLTYEEVLLQIPAISYDNQRQVMVLPEITPTRSVKWVLDLTRLRTIYNLLSYEASKMTDVQKQQPGTSFAPRNLDTRAYIKRRLIILNNDRPINVPLDLETTSLFERVTALL
jgi:hypothetical protein